MIHTFHLVTPPLSYCQSQDIEKRIYEYAKQGNCKIVGRKEHLIFFVLPAYRGFRLCLNKLTVPHISMIVNPAIAVGGGYRDLYSLTPSLLDVCMDQISCVLREFNLRFGAERMILSRIDCTADIRFPYENALEAFMSCAQRTNPPRGYQIQRFGRGYSDYEEMNRHSFRMSCQDVSLTIYDKTYQLLNEGLIETSEVFPGHLRFEVALHNRAFQRLFVKYGGGIFLNCADDENRVKQIIFGFSNLSLKILRDYFRQNMASGQYLRGDLALQCIDKGPFSAKVKAKMKLLLAEVARCHKGGIGAALKNLEGDGFSQNELQYLLKCFEKIDLNPATIKGSAGCLSFPSIAELLNNEDLFIKPLSWNGTQT